MGPADGAAVSRPKSRAFRGRRPDRRRSRWLRRLVGRCHRDIVEHWLEGHEVDRVEHVAWVRGNAAPGMPIAEAMHGVPRRLWPAILGHRVRGAR